MSNGYSATPLARKLGVKPGAVVCSIGAPADYRSWLEPLPPDVVFVARPGRAGCDIVHVFVARLADLDGHLSVAREAIKPDGAIWVSWYKKAAKMPSDVTEDHVRSRALAGDLVDVKVCAVSALWSGLKLVVRKHLRRSQSAR